MTSCSLNTHTWFEARPELCHWGPVWVFGKNEMLRQKSSRGSLGNQGALAQSRSSLRTSPSPHFAPLWEGKQHFLFIEFKLD